MEFGDGGPGGGYFYVLPMTEYGNYRDARLKSLVDGTYPETIADCLPPRVYSVNNIKAISN